VDFTEFLRLNDVVISARKAAWPAELQELRDTFAKFDANGDGHLTTDELVQALGKLWGRALTKDDAAVVRQMVKQFDADGSGTIEFEEVAALRTALISYRDEQDAAYAADAFKLRRAFDSLDEKAEGTIPIRAVSAALERYWGRPLTAEEAEELQHLTSGTDAAAVQYGELQHMRDELVRQKHSKLFGDDMHRKRRRFHLFTALSTLAAVTVVGLIYVVRRGKH